MNRLESNVAFLCVIFLAGFFSGCGSGGGSTQPTWNVTVTQLGSFAPGGAGQYMITIFNSGSSATSGTVTMTDTLPSNGVFTATSLTGTGWTCSSNSVSCTRSDALAGGASYPQIVLGVSVAANASGTVTDQVNVSGGGAGDATKSQQTQIGMNGNGKIDHIVVIFQENRSPDNLFHDSVLMARGAHIASQGQDSSGNTITLTQVSLVTNYDLDHGHDSFLKACDWNGTACAMDGEDKVNCAPPDNCPSHPQYQYVDPNDVQPYFSMAETYAFGDNMFQTNQGPSFPAHQYIISGSSAICVPGAACPSGLTDTFYMAGNPSSYQRADGTGGAGCLMPPGAVINVIDTSQPFPNPDMTSQPEPVCAEHPAITDLLDSAGLSWRYYAAADGSIWTGPDGIKHMCEPAGPPDQLACTAKEWNNHVVIEGTSAQIVSDIQGGYLANVTWVIPDGQASDHPAGNTGLGPSWVASIVNAIGESQFWSTTAIIVTWDDWGGWYDHAPPPIQGKNSYEYGFRVPLIVISPYAKPAYISHEQDDFGSILKFMEETFSLPAIGTSVGVQYADSYAVGDLSDFFSFAHPQAFRHIQAEHDAEFFIHRHVKPTPPDTD